MKNKQFFILILFLVIGFASISATLVINGNTKVATNIDDFNVIFIEGFLNGEINEDVIISGDKKTLTFTTNKLTNINDTARIDYKVKNISTQYDGDVTINCTNAANEFVRVTSSFDGHNLPLTTSINMQAQEVKSGYINAELIKATTEDQEVKITCKIEVNATSRTNYAYSLVFDSDGGSAIDDKSVNLNDSYGELEEPTKEGYTFIGWFNEDDVMIGSDTVFDSKGNRNLHAKWSKNAYPVTIVKNYPDKSETIEINIPYGESINTSLTIDDNYFIDDIECDNGYTIENFNSEKAIYEKQTITINNNYKTKSCNCNVTMKLGIYKYSYTGSQEKVNIPYDGNYKVELWGASGGYKGSYLGGSGAYTSGVISLEKDTYIYLQIGSVGGIGDYHTGGTAGYNGGAAGADTLFTGPSNTIGSGGGGATDMRIVGGNWNDFSSLKARIMVAAGGGGSSFNITSPNYAGAGGSAGGLLGYDSPTKIVNNVTGYGTGAGQIVGGTCISTSGYTVNSAGSFGKANTTEAPTGYFNPGGGGGSGYYGGGSSVSAVVNTGSSGGGGGSSFISGHNGCDAIAENSTSSNITHTGQSNHYSGLVFTDTIMVDGAGYKWTNVKGSYTGMPTHDGTSTMTGNTGDGYAKITYLGK